jgi:hypothetical protein
MPAYAGTSIDLTVVGGTGELFGHSKASTSSKSSLKRAFAKFL